ncbi:MAG TPA: membrane protein insertase YidC, partial [Blastocatellia bacterium]|nr:membrane protein insertase YidC [Blastocatellia bacterium]
MDRSRLILALALSLLVLMSWPLIARYMAPRPPIEETVQIDQPAQEQKQETKQQPPASTTKKSTQQGSSSASRQPTQATQVPPREITINTHYWRAKLSNRGAVATSWILDRYEEGGREREITGADGNKLQLIPQQIPEYLAAPWSLRTPWSPEIGSKLNGVNFQVEGIGPNDNEINLTGPGDTRTISFVYSSPAVSAKKTFTFHGDSFVVDITVDVKTGGSEQPAEIVLGPRFGDQSDKQTGSYSTPPQVVAYTR